MLSMIQKTQDTRRWLIFIVRSGSESGLRRQACRWSPDKGLLRLMPVGVTETSEATLAVTPLMQGADEGCEIWQMPGRDLGCGGQML